MFAFLAMAFDLGSGGGLKCANLRVRGASGRPRKGVGGAKKEAKKGVAMRKMGAAGATARGRMKRGGGPAV